MNWRQITQSLGLVLGYVSIALVFAWPLPLYLGSRLTGEPGGDTGVYVWNQWVFQHEALGGSNPLTTGEILSLSERVDLSQHNYTAFLNLLALPLIPWAGVVPSFNLVYLLTSVITALCTYALARRAFDTTRLEAFVAGVAFAWSPVLVARSTGHFSLVAAAPLPAFLLCLINAERTRSMWWAALAGVSMAWAGFCDAYYAVFCLMIAIVYVLSRVLVVSKRPTPLRDPWVWALNVLILAVGGLVIGLAFGGSTRIDILGVPVSVRGLYTPVLALTILVLLRVGLAFRARLVQLRPEGWLVKAAVVGVLACAGPLAPVLYGLGQSVLDGQFVSPPIYWRSSPRGVDLAAFFHPNPNHAVSRWLFGDRQAVSSTEYVEYTAALSLVALAVVGVATWRGGFRPPKAWWALTAGFAALALGPFVVLMGTTTYVPGPWALLRYVPVINAVRTPTRFAVVASLGLAVLLAGALAAIGTRWPHRRRAVGIAVLALVLVELFPAPRTLYSATISPVYNVIAADPRPVRVLSLPFGVRDGVSSAGNFSARSQFNQTAHGKRLIGGYLSRVSSSRLESMRRDYPVLAMLITLSEGRSLPPDERATLFERGPSFVEETELGYVVIDHSLVSSELTSLAIEAFGLEEIMRDNTLTLYRPR